MSRVPYTNGSAIPSMRIGAVLAHKNGNGHVNPILADALQPFAPQTSPRAPHARLRGRKQVQATKLLVRAQELVREAYDKLQSAGSLLLTAGATASAQDRETIELSRRVLCDCAADTSQVAYVLPREYHRALDAACLPVCANGRSNLANFT